MCDDSGVYTFGIKEIEPSTKGVRKVSVMITALIKEKKDAMM